MGYGDEQLRELERTIDAAECDVVDHRDADPTSAG